MAVAMSGPLPLGACTVGAAPVGAAPGTAAPAAAGGDRLVRLASCWHATAGDAGPHVGAHTDQPRAGQPGTARHQSEQRAGEGGQQQRVHQRRQSEREGEPTHGTDRQEVQHHRRQEGHHVAGEVGAEGAREGVVRRASHGAPCPQLVAVALPVDDGGVRGDADGHDHAGDPRQGQGEPVELPQQDQDAVGDHAEHGQLQHRHQSDPPVERNEVGGHQHQPDGPRQQARVQGAATQGRRNALNRREVQLDRQRTGALPIELDLATVQSVSPTLGRGALDASLLAGAIGLVLVAAYLVALYRGIGFVAVLELAMFGVVTYGILILLGEFYGLTLTLAGIAGVIVSIGIAADSSIIYRERYRDELRAGRTVRSASDHAFTRSFGTNLTGNMVSFLAAVVLYFLAVGPVRGFAFTLGLSTLVDTLLLATFTRSLFGLVARSPRLARSRLVGMRANVGTSVAGGGVPTARESDKAVAAGSGGRSGPRSGPDRSGSDRASSKRKGT